MVAIAPVDQSTEIAQLQLTIVELSETIKQQQVDMEIALDLTLPNTTMCFINQALMLALELGLTPVLLKKGVHSYTGKESLSECDLEEVKLIVAKLVTKVEAKQEAANEI